tara:strand:- start:4641 stop:5405 length:765 start_codon:yes stop_codon:yes gene_type:complete
MQAHPEIYVPRIADLYYFDRLENYSKGNDWYLDYFDKVNPAVHKAVGELSHDYIFSTDAAERISEFNPKMKLLITIRNPIELAYSQYISDWNAGTVNISFEKALKDNPKFVYECSYSNFIPSYTDIFGKDRIKILEFEMLEKSPPDYIREITDFLEVSYFSKLSKIKMFNSAAEPRLPGLGVVAKVFANQMRFLGLNTFLGVVKSNRLIRSLIFKPHVRQMAINFRHLNSKYFSKEKDYLEELLQKDLGNWYDD